MASPERPQLVWTEGKDFVWLPDAAWRLSRAAREAFVALLLIADDDDAFFTDLDAISARLDSMGAPRSRRGLKAAIDLVLDSGLVRAVQTDRGAMVLGLADSARPRGRARRAADGGAEGFFPYVLALQARRPGHG